MKEVFQDYNHYSRWLLENWHKTISNDEIIISCGLVVERELNCNGEAFRQLKRNEFEEKDAAGFIPVPQLNEN